MIQVTTQPKQSGFSLVETLVAITILLIVIVGPMTLAANATRSSNFSTEQVTASFLAQEGLEIAQKFRDDNILPFMVAAGLPNEGWDSIDTTNCSESAGGCGVFLTDGSPRIVNSTTGCGANRELCRVYLNDDLDSHQRYIQTSSPGTLEPTIYYRTVTVDSDLVFSNQLEVTSEVTWRTGEQRQEQSVEMVTYLYNIYGR